MGQLIQNRVASPVADKITETHRAEWRIELYQRHMEISVEQVIGLSKWLTASLFAANSGGLLTLLNQSEKITFPFLAGGLFIAGFITAMLSATANQEVYNRMSDPLVDMIGYWQEVRITGQPNTETHDAIADRMKSLEKWMWIGPSMGWISGLMFIGGVITVAWGLR